MSQTRKRRRGSAVRDRLESLKAQGRAALMPFLTIGWPDPESFVHIATTVGQKGADVLELGMPFSDPVADGPVIQATSREALQHGVTFAKGLALARRVSEVVPIPVVLMTYYNPLLRGGLEARCHAIAQAGLKGIIVPDLPPEEGGALEHAAGTAGLDLTYLCSPTSSRSRMQLIALHSRGFLYLVSTLGTTGVREQTAPRLAEFIQEVRRFTVLPLCVGFGISNPQQVREVGRMADGCIVGSALIREIAKAAPDRRTTVAGNFISEMRASLESLARERSAQHPS